MKRQIEQATLSLVESLDDRWLEATKEAIEGADGRKDPNDPICRTASCLYVAYAGKEVLYVGETSKSIKRRFISDGDGSHKKACSWYGSLTHVRYATFEVTELPVKHRKMMEQVLAIHLKPRFYGSRQ